MATLTESLILRLPRDVLNLVFSFFHPEELLAVKLAFPSFKGLQSLKSPDQWSMSSLNRVKLSRCFYRVTSKEFPIWLHTVMRVPWPVIFKAAAERGRVDLLEFIASQEKPEWSYADTDLSLGRGGLGVLLWATDRGCPLTPPMLSGAAESGDVAAVKWLREKKVLWDSGKCIRYGARGGSEWILTEMIFAGASKLLVIAEDAAELGYIHVLEWMVNNKWTVVRTSPRCRNLYRSFNA